MAGFVANEYEELIGQLVDRGYEAVGLNEIEVAKPQMFLRHDVDLCMERALQVARREASLGLKATYYFLLSTDLYNIASAKGREVLIEMRSLGHEIGLHFDVLAYPNQQAQIEICAEVECTTLESLANASVNSISFHRPVKALLNRKGKFAGRRHTYEPEFFSSIGYISDSNGGWHHGHPLDHPAVIEKRAIQLLTHPIWWCGDNSLTVTEAIDAFRQERIDQLTCSLTNTITAYRSRRV